IDYAGESVTFAGDMDETALPNLKSIAQGSDLLVVHTAVVDPPGSPAELYTRHTAPRLLGEAARDAGVHAVLMSHLAPAVEAAIGDVQRSIGVSFKGQIRVAHDGLRLRVRPDGGANRRAAHGKGAARKASTSATKASMSAATMRSPFARLASVGSPHVPVGE